MDRVHRSEWIEWLDGLHMGGSVILDPPDLLPSGSSRCRLSAADYAPFEDLIELVFDSDLGMLRVLLESPVAIWIDDEGTGCQRVLFELTSGSRVTLESPTRAA